MSHPHNHEEWLAQRKAKQANQDNKTSDGAAKRKLSEDKPGSSKQTAAGKLKLSKSLNTALVSKVQLSDAKIQDDIDCAMNAADDNKQNDDEDASK
eukprot:10161915-Ditylum_brightwellii.AAC.1